jgi:DNA-binding PadR family transcriptional regulator
MYICTTNKYIMQRDSIGELEEFVLLAVGSLSEQAYAIAILEVIQEQTGRKLDVTSIHSVLRRLDKKGYVKSSMAGATKERGGRRKRLFTLTQAGRAVIDGVMSARLSLYNKMSNAPTIGLSR